MSFFLSILPLLLLIFLMTKHHPLPSYKALGISAVFLYVLKILYWKSDFLTTHAGIISGILTAWTPILVIWGAVLLFQFMDKSGALKTILEWLSGIVENKVEQIMLIGWSFSFFVEGISGFGTPSALTAPLLIKFGFPPLQVVMLCLVLNSVPVSFGAVGTPLWFGLGNLGLLPEELLEIGQHTAIIHFIAGLIIPFVALRFLLSWKEIRQNSIFILLAILSCTIPYLALSLWNIEFPSLLGGAIGLGLTTLIAKNNIGLAPNAKKRKMKRINRKKLFQAFFPLGGVIVLLLLTRIEILGLKNLLTSQAHSIHKVITGIGDVFLSPSLVLGWNNILGTNESWSHALLYVPSFLPFFAVVGLGMWIYKSKKSEQKYVWSHTWHRMKGAILALTFALIFVKLLMTGSPSPAMIIGKTLAHTTGQMWSFFSPFLGAVGGFFSGSNTVSNLTFGAIQMNTAQTLHLPYTIILALQNVGGAIGNMVSIQNIIAVCAVVGLTNKTGDILKKNIWSLLLYAFIAGSIGLLWTL